MVVARSLKPGSEFAFFKAVQKAFYLESKDPHVVDTYYPICDAHGINRSTFKAEWESAAMKQAVQQDFQRAGQMGVRSFPTVLLYANEKLQPLAVGYASFEEMQQRLGALVN